MDTFERLADRFSLPLARLLAAIHTVLLAWFISVLIAAMTPAQAQAPAPACNATNILPQLEAEHPGVTRRIEEGAAKIPNGKGLLWKVEKAGVEPSFLFGTMHLTDPRVVTLTPPAQEAFDKAQTVVIETTDILDPAKMAAAMAADPGLTMYLGNESLKTALPADKMAEVEAALAKRGIPAIAVMKMKPWLISTMLAAPQCEIARKQAGLPVLDQKLAEDAMAAGKEVLGLEKAVDQLRAMNEVPVEFHIQGLLGLLALGDEMDGLFETMTELYLEGETGMFKPLFEEAEKLAPEVASNSQGYAEFEQIMVDKRNLGMAGNSAPILAKGNAFIAVGALHLPGEKGLVEEFRKLGYTVTAVP